MSTRIEGKPVVPPLYIDSANGYVGVGASSPTKTLQVSSPSTNTVVFEALASDGSSLATLFESTGGAGRLMVKDAAGSTTGQISADSHSYIASFGLTVGSNSSPGSNAIILCDTTTKGFLPPRLTTTEKNNIASPTAGLVVYDTTLNKLCVYTGAAWQTVTSA